jgi:DNA polymerase-3 subunit gamma/tau
VAVSARIAAAGTEPATNYSSVATLIEEAPAEPQEAHPTPIGAPTVEAVRLAIGAALVEAGHDSASQLLGAGAWTLEATSLRIEVPMTKKMLALTINAAAEKIIRQELQRLAAPTRFLIVPGEGAASTAPIIAVAPLAGSIQEAALSNPLVQRAKEIFNAEVRSVVDLRQK